MTESSTTLPPQASREAGTASREAGGRKEAILTSREALLASREADILYSLTSARVPGGWGTWRVGVGGGRE
jgi:hypothetical protein